VALFGLLEEWTSSRTRPERIANLHSGTGPVLDGTGYRLENGTTVFADGAADVLNGAAGIDWFFFLAGEDKVNGLGNDEQIN